MYSEQQRADDAVQLVKTMPDENKDNMFKQMVGEQRFEVFKKSLKYAEIRDKTIMSEFFMHTYGNEKLTKEEMVETFKDSLRKRDLNIKYRSYAIQGLNKFPNARDFILLRTGEEKLDPSLMNFKGGNGEGAKIYLYGGRFSIVYENSPVQISVQDMMTGELLYSSRE